MKLFKLPAIRLGSTLLSYVDDGTAVTQSKSLDDNNAVLKQAYAILFVLFAALGLVLEHDKTELFYFDRSHSDHNPPLDLGYAPYTGDRLLTPKTYWEVFPVPHGFQCFSSGIPVEFHHFSTGVHWNSTGIL